MKYYIQVTFCKQIFRSTISSFQSPHKFLGLEILPSYVCHSNGGIFLKACSCKANQVHESRVEADRRADGVRLESSSRAKQSKAKFTRGEADCRADGVRLECRRDFSLRMVKGRPATPLVPELKFCQRFLLCTTPVYKLLLAKIEQSALFS